MALLGEADVGPAHAVGQKTVGQQDAGQRHGAADGEPGHGAPKLEPGRADVSDRRRPGRLQVTNPHLIPVLRGAPDLADDTPGEPDPLSSDSRTDDLSAAHGLMVGLLLAIPIWCAIIIGVSRMLR